MTTQPLRRSRRALTALALVAVLSVTGMAGVVTAVERTFDITGTVHTAQGSIVTIITSDLIGKEQPILVDVSQLQGFQAQPGEPLQLTIRSREADTYLALRIVRTSPYVNGAEFGVREEFTTKQDSIQAGVGNVPEDDEALAKQHRDKNLRKQDDDEDRRRR